MNRSIVKQTEAQMNTVPFIAAIHPQISIKYSSFCLVPLCLLFFLTYFIFVHNFRCDCFSFCFVFKEGNRVVQRIARRFCFESAEIKSVEHDCVCALYNREL